MKGNTIILPRINGEGKPRISYSQVKLWKEKCSFNLKEEGWIEYIVIYFLEYIFPDEGYGEFGKDVEDFIMNRGSRHKFTDKELFTLEKITPLGIARDLEVDFGDFILLVKIDDCTEDFRKIRDYKTGSENSLNQYRTKEYRQLATYQLAVHETFGFIPEADVCAIERKGTAYSKGRKALTVGDQIWTIPSQHNTLDDLRIIKDEIFETVREISEYFRIFKILNK